jgi:hypothetical protein
MFRFSWAGGSQGVFARSFSIDARSCPKRKRCHKNSEWRTTWECGARHWAIERSKPLGALFGVSHHCMTLLGSIAGSKPATTGILMLSAPGQYHTPGVAWTYGWLVPGGMGGGASAR